MESAILIMLGLVAVAVVWIAASLRNYQRIDYSRILEQDDYIASLDARIAYLEELIAAQQADFDRREAQWQDMLAAAREQFSHELLAARTQLRVPQPAVAQQEAAPQRSVAGRPRPTAAPVSRSPQPPPRPAPAPRSPRQQDIARLLESGVNASEIAQQLGVSRHEVELVEAIVLRAAARS